MNIYDIAEQSGVSIATVSRVLNGSPSVSPATREKVLSVMRRGGEVAHMGAFSNTCPTRSRAASA